MSYKEDLLKPVMKQKRELVADIYMTLVGIVTAILAIKSGGWVKIFGWIVIGMIIILFLTPEK